MTIIAEKSVKSESEQSEPVRIPSYVVENFSPVESHVEPSNPSMSSCTHTGDKAISSE